MKAGRINIAKNFLLAALFAATLTAGSGAAHAALLSDTEAFSFDGNTSPYTLLLNSFNPALGTLTDITLTTVTHITPQVQLINFTNASQSFTNAQSTSPFTLNGPGNTVVNATASTGLISGSAAPGPFIVSTYTGLTVDQTQTIQLASTIWSQYTVSGPLSFLATLGPFTSSASFVPGTLAVGGNGQINGDVTIAYTYNATPTPIPAAAWLLGSGLMGLVGIRRRQK